MSREKRDWEESQDDFYKKSYIIYFLHKGITERELRYIGREIERNRSNFKGLVVFTEIQKYLNKPRFDRIQYEESYIIPYESDIWSVFKRIKDENLMHYINFQATNYLVNNTKDIVVCLENCVEYVRGYLDKRVEVICLESN